MFELKIKHELKDLDMLTKKYPMASRAARISKLTEAVLLLERAVRMKTPEGAGPIHLRDTVFHDVSAAGGYFGASVAGIVGTFALYGEPVEYGTRPHWPPLGPLEYWVSHKFGIQGAAARAVAFLVARKISKKGTKGAHMFEKGFNEAEPLIRKILDRIPEDIERMLH